MIRRWLPLSPSRPQKARNILLAFLVGLVGGIGLALFREYLDNTVKSPDDIEALTGLPSLAVVPSLPGLARAHEPVLAAGARGGSAIRVRTARRIALLHSAKIANFGSVSRAAHFLAAFAGRSSAAGDSGDQRVAARRKNNCGGESGRHAWRNWATARLLMDSDLRKPGIRRALNLTGRQRSGPQFVSRRRFDSRRSD